jgi:isoquinoline 1-oxidoreductase beta subunit
VPVADYVAEAAEAAKAWGKPDPVKLVWKREDDMKAGYNRPAYLHRVKVGLDENGDILAWRHTIVGQSILAGTPFARMINNGVDPNSVEGVANLPYAAPNLHVELHTTEVGVPTLWWRSVGHTHTAYVVETMIDRIAAESGRDPVAFRLAALRGKPRHLGVLKLAAEKAGWGEPAPEGVFRGVAVHESFRTYVAEVVEVRVKDGAPKVERVVCAVDCGLAVNPDVVKAQMEGGVGFGLGAALRDAITLSGGVVDQANFDTYQPLRMSDMPRVEAHIVPSAEPPTGVGEPGAPPLAPAVANAMFLATGKRIVELPMIAHPAKGA